MARGATPQDSYHLVGISFFILGLGTLLPWNFFITAIPYFQGRLAGANSTARTLGTNHTGPADTFNFNNWVTLLSQLPLLLFTLLNSFLYQCIPETVRILGSLLVILLLFALTAMLVKVDMRPGPFFSITMASVWFINSFCAVLQGSLFGQLGTMPSTYSTLFLSGQGLAGIFAALAMLMSMASGVDAQTSALGYFITPCVGIFVSIVCYLSLPHMELARYYLAKKPSLAQGQELETKAELLQSGEKNGIPNSPQKTALTLNLDPEKESELEPEEPQKPGKPSVFIVFRKIWLTALCLVLVFTVTLSVFPAITAMVTSSTSPGKWRQASLPPRSVLQPHLLLPPLQHHGLAGTEPDLLLPVAGPGQPAAAPAGLPARPVHSALHAVPRAPAVPAAHHLPAGRLLHHLHAALCCFQRLPGVPHHVPGAQAGAATREGGGRRPHDLLPGPGAVLWSLPLLPLQGAALKAPCRALQQLSSRCPFGAGAETQRTGMASQAQASVGLGPLSLGVPGGGGCCLFPGLVATWGAVRKNSPLVISALTQDGGDTQRWTIQKHTRPH